MLVCLCFLHFQPMPNNESTLQLNYADFMNKRIEALLKNRQDGDRSTDYIFSSDSLIDKIKTESEEKISDLKLKWV